MHDMISRIEGELVSVENSRAEVGIGAITYEVLIPGTDGMRLSGMIGHTVVFHTLHYLEAQGQGSSFIPRIIGFSSPHERAFFELFTTVKGLGSKKALRALQLPFADVAAASAARDHTLLISLPEIGKRTADTIIAELHGKVDRFVEFKPLAETGSDQAQATGRLGLIRDASAILSQLGEPKLQARQLADRALEADSAIESVDELVAAAFRLKELI